MALDVERLQEAICKGMCADVRLHPRQDGRVAVESPFILPDGDGYPIFLEQLPSGGVRITDAGVTLMRMSYVMDLDKLREGRRSEILDEIVGESPVSSKDGEFFLDSSVSDLGRSIFVFGQTITRIHDLTLWQQARVAGAFLDDIEKALLDVVADDRIVRSYIVPGMQNGDLYPVDFYVRPATPSKPPLLLFGISSERRAMSATIVLLNLKPVLTYESLLVFSDMGIAKGRVLGQLLNAGGESVLLSARDAFTEKVMKRVAA